MKKRFSILFLSVILLAGCASSASRWRDDAADSFNSALSAGSQECAVDETESIRQTLALADRYFSTQQYEEADRLYRLSSQKSRLLARSLVLSKLQQSALAPVQYKVSGLSEEVAIGSDSSIDKSALMPIAFESIAIAKERIYENTPAFELRPPAVSVPSHSPVRSRKSRQSGAISKSSSHDLATIYLTFDDGPSRLTLPIASFLNSQGIAATFFALGNNIARHEKVVTDIIALGHKVGNHTQSHDLRKLHNSFQSGVNEIDKTAALLDKLGGDGKMIRIPYGANSKKLSTTVASEGGQIFDWDINSFDSSRRGVNDHAFIEQAVLQQLHNSGKQHIIMLFHDGSGHDATLTAIRTLVPRLKREGYRFGLLNRTDRVAQSTHGGSPTP